MPLHPLFSDILTQHRIAPQPESAIDALLDPSLWPEPDAPTLDIDHDDEELATIRAAMASLGDRQGARS